MAAAAVLGILKSGRAIVPLDTELPVARLSLITDESEAAGVVTNTGNLRTAKKLAEGRRKVLNIDEIASHAPDENPDPRGSPDDLAWIIYTSGSTGRPKGAMQTHRNALHQAMNYTHYFHVCPDDRLSDLFSFATHAGMFQLLLPLLTGAALLPLDLRNSRPEQLRDWLRRLEVTVCCMVPSAFRHFAAGLSGDRQFPNLRLVYVAGEPSLRTDLELFQKHMPPECIFVNRLGSTETDCIRLFFADRQTRITTAGVPAGFGVRDKEMTIVDEGGNPASFGEVGEIAVKSRYIFTGYWRRPELTKAAFTIDGDERTFRTGDLGVMHEDGCVEHRGRKDFQVKIRGYRVEIAEVEAALLEDERVKDAAVVTRESSNGLLQLVAYLVPAAEPAPATSAFRRILAEKLPGYMVPAVFVILGALPRTPNGKVDRRRLPSPGSDRPELDTPFVAPSDPVEQSVTAIWADVLGLNRVGVNDAFLELGGHSLLAMQILSRVESTVKVGLSMRQLFDAPTVALMAAVIKDAAPISQ